MRLVVTTCYTITVPVLAIVTLQFRIMVEKVEVVVVLPQAMPPEVLLHVIVDGPVIPVSQVGLVLLVLQVTQVQHLQRSVIHSLEVLLEMAVLPDQVVLVVEVAELVVITPAIIILVATAMVVPGVVEVAAQVGYAIIIEAVTVGTVMVVSDQVQEVAEPVTTMEVFPVAGLLTGPVYPLTAGPVKGDHVEEAVEVLWDLQGRQPNRPTRKPVAEEAVEVNTTLVTVLEAAVAGAWAVLQIHPVAVMREAQDHLQLTPMYL